MITRRFDQYEAEQIRDFCDVRRIKCTVMEEGEKIELGFESEWDLDKVCAGIGICPPDE
jgi:hypothetical protein